MLWSASVIGGVLYVIILIHAFFQEESAHSIEYLHYVNLIKDGDALK